MSDLMIALEEEIGDPDLFTGRVAELDNLLAWAEGAKGKLSKSKAILSRRKKGKTALVQRFFNLLYSRNDPQLIPFFIRIKEKQTNLETLAKTFFRTFMSQYLGFRKRDPWLVKFEAPFDVLKQEAEALGDEEASKSIDYMLNFVASSADEAWNFAQDLPHRLASVKNIRIIQIIDEFQFLNRFIVDEHGPQNLCHSYMGAAESKVAPLLVTGSYIGWLDSILTHMTNRFDEMYLGGLTDEEAIQAVYNYATILKRPIRENTAPYIAGLAMNDPFYISQMIRSNYPKLDLTTEDGVREVMQYETTEGQGFIAKTWLEYVFEAFQRVNEINSKRIVLYLAKRGSEERTREQIRTDLKLDLSDEALEQRLHKLHMADLIARGSSNYRYRGLGDPIFEVVFRKVYGEEIEKVHPQDIAQDFDDYMRQFKRQTAWVKGLNCEYKVRHHLLFGAVNQVSLSAQVYNAPADLAPKPYQSMNKERIATGVESSREIDIYARGDDFDLVIEVKNWEKAVSNREIELFLALKKSVEGSASRKTFFLFYSENGFSTDQEDILKINGVMYSDGARLTAYEADLDGSD